MERTTLKGLTIGGASLVVVFALVVFIIEQLDNPGEQIQAPDKATSFVATLDLRALVKSATPPALELKPVTSGSGSGAGQFKFDRKRTLSRGALLHGASTSKHIEFKITADPEVRAALLTALGNALQNSLRRWQPKVEVRKTARPEGVAAPEGFALDYRAEGMSGEYEGQIRVAMQQVPTQDLGRSETGQVIHALTVATSEDRWGRAVGGIVSASHLGPHQ